MVHDHPSLNSFRRSVVDITNHQRHAAGVCRNLQLDPMLCKSAQHVARRKARSGILRHSQFWFKVLEKISRERPQHEAENLADGFDSPHDVCEAWRNSPEHWVNSGNPFLRRIGVGIAVDRSGKVWWVEHFGG